MAGRNIAPLQGNIGTSPHIDARSGVLPKPDAIRFSSTLLPASWTSYLGADGLGEAFFTISASGVGQHGGLEVYIVNAAVPGAASNGFEVTLTQDTTNDVTVTNTADTKTIAITHTAAATLATIKGLVDAETELNSRYYDGQDGTGTVDALGLLDANGLTQNGHDPLDCWARIVVDGDGRYKVQYPQPNGFGEAAFISSNDIFYAFIPRGERIWFHRIGGADIDGSVEIWKLADG